MSNSIFEALNEIKGKVESGDLSIKDDGTPSATFQAGSVSSAKKLPPEQDTMRGKRFVYLEGSQRGMQEEVDYTIEMNSKYYVVFKSGLNILVENLNLQMTEVENYTKSVRKVDGLMYEDEPDIGDIRPGRLNPNPAAKAAGLEEFPPIFADDAPILTEGLDEFKPLAATSSPVARQQQQPVREDPIFSLLNKMKKAPKSIKLDLTLNIPTVSLYTMLTENFEGAEEAIIEFLTTGKNFKDFKEQFKTSLIEYYKRSVKKTKKINTEEDDSGI